MPINAAWTTPWNRKRILHMSLFLGARNRRKELHFSFSVNKSALKRFSRCLSAALLSHDLSTRRVVENLVFIFTTIKKHGWQVICSSVGFDDSTHIFQLHDTLRQSFSSETLALMEFLPTSWSCPMSRFNFYLQTQHPNSNRWTQASSRPWSSDIEHFRWSVC